MQNQKTYARLSLLWEDPKIRAYISFSSLFNAFVCKWLTIENLKGSLFLFGCKRDYVFTTDPTKVPQDAACVLGHNVWTDPQDAYPQEMIPNSEKYFEFKNIIEEADKKGLVTWGVNNYPSLIRQLRRDGYEVYYRGNIVEPQNIYDEAYKYSGPYIKKNFYTL